MATLVSERFCAVRLALWERGTGAANASDREAIRTLGMVDENRQPNIPDILLLDAEGRLLERAWSFVSADEMFDVLGKALSDTGHDVPFERGASFGDTEAGQQLRSMESASVAALDAWIDDHGENLADLLPIAHLYRAEAAARAGEGAVADASWRALARSDHPTAHRARFHLLNFDIWPITRHYSLEGAQPARADRYPTLIPDPELREENLKRLGDDPAVRWTADLPFIRIPAGSFTMGWNEAPFLRERPERRITLSRDYWLAAWPVTRALWMAFQPRRWPHGELENQMPALGVSWTDVQTFLAWLSAREGVRFRLPTEAEWARAARGGVDGAPFPWGDAPVDPTRCNVDRPQTVPVACYPPNLYGLYDVLGNGLEWVQDLYRPDALSRMKDGAVDPICLDPTPQHAGLRVQKSMFPAPLDLVTQLTYTASRTYGLQDQSFGGRGFRIIAEFPQRSQ